MSFFAVLAIALVVAFAATCNAVNMRLTTAFGNRSETKIRATFVDVGRATAAPHTDAFLNSFQYNAPFKYRWTSNAVHTALKDIQLGVPNTIDFGTPGSHDFKRVQVNLPRFGQGVRGVITADPCGNSPISVCEDNMQWNITSTYPDMVNTAMGHDSMSFWMMLGDNFYDPNGETANPFWQTVSPAVNNKMFYSVPGNWDFWASGRPDELNVTTDQFGNGFMQYYGMDTQASSLNGPNGIPFDFSVNPDDVSTQATRGQVRKSTSSRRNKNKGNKNTMKSHSEDTAEKKHGGEGTRRQHFGGGSKSTGRTVQHHSHQPNQRYLASIDNFNWYTQLGNVAFVGYSSAHHKEDIDAFMSEACAWVGDRETVEWVILVGHWVKRSHGATDSTIVPAVFEDMKSLPGCARKKVKFFAGHEHCNKVVTANDGWMVGAFGKTSSECEPQYGLPYFDSTNNRLQVVYFPIADRTTGNAESRQVGMTPEEAARYRALVECAGLRGLGNCMHLPHIVWLNETLV